ncbi:MAG TPA: 50S ribosomal protein L11 [Acidilobales archaeon]|nr:50S ribosomal protein L11 [Acidilobales archaeon]
MLEGIELKTIITGSKVNPSQLPPSLSKYGLDTNEIAKKISEMTKEYEGMRVKVTIIVDQKTKNYEIRIKPPTITEILLKLVGASQPSGDPINKKIGDLSLEDIIKAALLKRPDLTAKTIKAAVKTVLGSARSIGITVNGKDPKEVIKEINEGLHDELLKKYEEEWVKR